MEKVDYLRAKISFISMFLAKYALAGAVLAATPSLAVAAAAEGEAYADSIVGLNEVSVTAIKATSGSRFPAAETVVGPSQIETYDIVGIRGVSDLVPNFFMPQYGSRMTSTIYVRGLGTRIDQPVVALNVDNVQILNKDNFDFNFPDIDRIEMVRGPQSILYGRNSMGGVVNIATVSPLKFSGLKALVEYGSGNTWRASASAYKHHANNFGAGFIVSMNSTDGFFRNQFTGRKVDSERQGLAKMKLSWRPADDLLVENSAWVALLRQGGYPYESVANGQINHNDTCYYKRTTVVDGLTVRYFGRDFSISSITGFQYHNDDMTLDQDFMPEDYFTLSQRRHEWSLTQDFVGKGTKGAYTWLGGLYGFYRRYNMNAPVTFGDYGIEHLIEDNINSLLPPAMQLKWDERSLLLDSRFHSPIWGWALYHKSEYAWQGFTLSAGLRLAFERTDFSYRSDVNTSATMYRKAGPQLIPLMTQKINLTLADVMHLTSLQLLPEFKLAYRFTPDFALGAIVSKGYKSGGYNTQIFSDILQQEMMKAAKPSMGGAPDGGESSYNPADVISYKPETSWNYEIDAKATFPAAGLSLDFSAFYLRCRDQQMTVFPDENSTGRMMANAGKTRSCGVELSAVYTPVEQLRLAASYGLADAKFVEFDDGHKNYKGNYVPYAPQNTLFLSATYRLSTPWSELTSIEPTLTCRGAGRIYWDEENSISQPFYAQLGASVTFRTPVADIDLWGENLTGTKFSSFYFESIGHQFLQRGNPRRLGVTVRFSLSFAQ